VPSSPEVTVAAHAERLNAIERRLDAVERLPEKLDALDQKFDLLRDDFNRETTERKLKEATKEDEKVKEDQKTKRFQAFLTALPIILAPILGVITSVLMQKPSDPPTVHVDIPAYVQEVDKCKRDNKDKTAWAECVRAAQLRNTPAFVP
jgi:hypothetical protein